ncbi:MAG: GntR family transcriptional regulator [Betaproteobacteria bacterium]
MTKKSSTLQPASTKKPSKSNFQATDSDEAIYQTIFESVMTQRLKPGTKLPEASLCELFKASRATVRKVLQKLAHDHIVELRPNRGASVAAPTPEQTSQIFEARRILESSIVRLAAANAKRTDIANLRQRLKQEHNSLNRLAQPEWVRLASSFHLAVAEAAGNPILTHYLVELVSRCSLIVALYEPPGNASCEHDEHSRIVDYIEKGDGDKAARLMEDHLSTLEKNISLNPEKDDNSLGRMLGLK